MTQNPGLYSNKTKDIVFTFLCRIPAQALAYQMVELLTPGLQVMEGIPFIPELTTDAMMDMVFPVHLGQTEGSADHQDNGVGTLYHVNKVIYFAS